MKREYTTKSHQSRCRHWCSSPSFSLNMALALLPTSTDVDFPVLLDNFWVRESKDRQTYAWTSNRLQQRFFFFEIHEETWHDKRQPYFTHNKIHNEALSYLSFPSFFIVITLIVTIYIKSYTRDACTFIYIFVVIILSFY